MEALIATAGNLINVLPAPLKALTAEVVSRIKFIRLRAVAVWFTNLSVFSVLSNRAISSCNGGFGSTTWCTWHSTGLSPGSVPSLAFLLSISSIFFSARSMCVCLVVIEFVMLSIFWAGWVVVSAAFFVSRGSEHVEYPENNFKFGGNLTEWHSTGLSPGSVPSFAFFLSISSIFFQQEACVYVWLSLVLACFVHFLGWLGGCVSCLFCFQGFRACRIPPKVISNLGVISRNGIPLGSLLEVFPALHFSFLFLQPSFQQEACVYVWLSLVLSCFVHFLGWLGGCVSCLFCFQGYRARRIPPKYFQTWGKSHGMAFHWALSWKCSQPLHSSFLFLPFSFSKKHVCMFGCHWFCHVLCIFWAGWVVVSAAFFVSRGSEHVEYPRK